MLTSPPQLLPKIVRPVEGDAKSSPSTLSIPHDMDLKPQIPPHSSSSCDDGEGQAEKRRSERLQATPKHKTESRNKPRTRKAAPKQSQIIASTKRQGNGRVVGWDENTAVIKPLKRKGLSSSNQNMALSTGKNHKDQMDCTTTESCDAAKGKDSPKSPAASKSWVIGPLLHSFKSKMTSFTEIVMSPVRLFKPTDLPPSDLTGIGSGEALSFSQTADSSSDSAQTQQANVSKTLHFDGSPHERTAELGKSKVKVEQPERECASSRLTRGALLRGAGPSRPDPLKTLSNQSVWPGVAGHCGDSSSCSKVADGPTLQRRPHIRQTTQKKSASPDYSMNVNDPQEVKANNLSDSSVFHTPPDSSKDDGTLELEDCEEGTPVVPSRQVRSSPRKLPKSITVTPAPFAAKRASSRPKVTGRKVTFDIKVQADDDDDDDEEEENVESPKSGGVSTDEEMNGESSCDAEAVLRRRQPEERKRTRKPLDTDPEWAGKEKRRMKAGTSEGATRRRGKNKNVAPKECLHEWLETSEEILYTRTTDCEVTYSGTRLLLNSHEATAETEMSEMDTSDDGLKFEGSSRLTRGQAKPKPLTPARVKVDPLEVEYSDCFTDCLAVSFHGDSVKSHNDKSINGKDNEDGIAGSLSRKARQRSKKDAAIDDSTPLLSKTRLKSEDDPSSVFSPNMENSSGSFLGTSTLTQSNCKSVRSSKRKLMKKCHQMYGEELPDDSPSASILKLDNTISEMGIPGEKEKDSELICKDTFTNESPNTASKSERGRALKRKSPSPSTKVSRVDNIENREEDCNTFMDTEKPPEATASGSGSNRLLRSYSCPEIASLSHHDQLWRSPPLPPHDRTTPVPTPHPPTPHLPPSPSKRARRHTVCSVEIEREIAPLCLRKEVYPTGRGGLYGSPSHPLCPSTASPSTSFTALVSSFLSSPLAFLSRRSDRGKRKACEDHDLITSTTSSSSSSSSSSLAPDVTLSCATSSPPFTLSSAVHHSLAGFTSPPRSSHFSASVSPGCSSHSQVSSEGEDDSGQQSEDGEENGHALSLDLLSRAMPEEKALSDSEIKMETKHGEQRKVSSIRIRKTLPKPLNNLTPMGLPKLIRPKKKEFSVEEIYTNKNFTKPAEGRLETIFEVPHKRRDGSHCLLGQKRVKRFVEFPELGKVRKLRKPLVTAGICSSTQKTGGQSSGGRPRRGAWSTFKDDSQPSPEDLDSLLCSKLDQLDSLMAADDGTS